MLPVTTLGTSDINYFSVEHSRRGYDSTGLSSVPVTEKVIEKAAWVCQNYNILVGGDDCHNHHP
jgi:hypothetical protein